MGNRGRSAEINNERGRAQKYVESERNNVVAITAETFYDGEMLEEKAISNAECRNHQERKEKANPKIIADYLLATQDLRKTDGLLFSYNSKFGFWEKITDGNYDEQLRKMLLYTQYATGINSNTLKEIYNWLKVQLDDRDGLKEGTEWLNFRDCALNWKTGEITENRKELLFDYFIDLEYRKITTNNFGSYNLEEYMDDVFCGDEDTIRAFKQFLGLALSGIRDKKLFFVLYGPKHAGKSAILNVLKEIVGKRFCSSVSFSQMANEFAVAKLSESRLNLSGEISGLTNKRIDIIKSLTGNDNVTASYKGKDHFEFRNQALLVFGSNSLPVVEDANDFDALLGRMIIFPYRKTIDRASWIPNLEDVLLQDVGTLIEFAIEGLRMLEENNFAFYESQSMLEAKQRYLEENNSFSVFAEDYLEEGEQSDFVSSKEIAGEYGIFCEELSVKTLYSNQWAEQIRQIFPNCVKGKKADCRGYYGLRFKKRGFSVLTTHMGADISDKWEEAERLHEEEESWPEKENYNGYFNASADDGDDDNDDDDNDDVSLLSMANFIDDYEEGKEESVW